MGIPVKSKIVTNPGELTEREFDGVIISQKRTKRGRFFMAYDDCLDVIILQNKLAGGDIQTLWWMAHKMGYDNICEYSITEIADEMNLTRRTVIRAVQRLLALQSIAPARTIGRTTFYMVSPHLFSRCRAEEHKNLIKRWDMMFNAGQPSLSLVEPKPKRSGKQSRSKKGKGDQGTAIA